jgi:hypothetical protein
VIHRKSETIDAEVLAAAIVRTPLDHYVVWTGDPRGRQRGSLRERALSCITEVGVPVSLRTLMHRAAQIDCGAGLHPKSVRCAVRMHQAASPAVYLLVRRTPLKDYVAVCDIPFPSGLAPISAGEVVIGRDGAWRMPASASNADVAPQRRAAVA